jgi:superfamily I DNA/RNA helicase
MDYQAFVHGEKTLLIAPAGYGKTHTIVECLKYTANRQLILTHTHAGVASIKEKIRNANIGSSRYNVETISSFAQKYVNSFYIGTDTPSQDNPKEYHPFIINKATAIFKCNSIKDVLKATYAGLFVDEYQDCTKLQHEFIVALSESLNTHILGDPLQGIFNFNGDLVDLDTDLSTFVRMPDLSTPYRWQQDGNNSDLGNKLKEIRSLIEQKKAIDFSSIDIEGLNIINITSDDYRNPRSEYRKSLNKLISNPGNNPDFDSLLIIVPEYEEVSRNGKTIPKGSILDRAQIRIEIDYSKSLTLLEAIDDRSFYSLSKKIDDLNISIKRARKPINKIRKDILEKIFYKSILNDWFNENGIKNKRNDTDKIIAGSLSKIIGYYISNPQCENMNNIILAIKNSLNAKYKREGLLSAILKATKQASLEEISVYEAMKNNRNMIRKYGRKIKGKCIGTTLLTKGLEFDTVAILDAHKFDDPKHFYVALTRCCKNLFIFSSQSTLSPYK